jgi:hypothetical protein
MFLMNDNRIYIYIGNVFLNLKEMKLKWVNKGAKKERKGAMNKTN